MIKNGKSKSGLKQTTEEPTPQQIPEEYELKNQSWRGAANALEYILSGKEENLIKGFLKDFTPKKEVIKGENKEDIEVTRKAPGLSVSSVFRLISFAFRHPIHAFNLIKLGRSPKIYQDPSFQKNMLEKEATWDFVKKRADDLPQIGRILESFGIEKFGEGQILDGNAMETIKGAFKDDANLKTIQELTLEALKPAPNWNRIIGKGLKLAGRDEHFKKYFELKKTAIRDYVKEIAEVTTKDDVIRAIHNIEKGKYKEMDILFQSHPKLLDKIAQILVDKNIKPEKMIEEIVKLPEVAVLDEVARKKIEEYIGEVKEKSTPLLKEYLDQYKVDPSILEVIPAFLSNIDKISIIYKDLQSVPLVGVGKVFDMIIEDKDLKEYFSKHPEFITNIAREIIEKNKNISEIAADFGFDSKMLEILSCVMVKPDIARAIVYDLNHGDYTHLTEELLRALNSHGFQGLKEELQKQANEGLFNKLIIGVIEQNAKLIQNNEKIISQLKNEKPETLNKLTDLLYKNYDSKATDAESIGKMIRKIMKSPEFASLSDEQKNALATHLAPVMLTMPEFTQLDVNNIRQVQKFVDTAVDKSKLSIKDTLQGYGVKENDIQNISSIFPLLLDHPADLMTIFNQFSESQYIDMTKKLLGMVSSDARIKQYFVENENLFVGVLNNIFANNSALEVYKLKGELYTIVPNLLNHSEDLVSIIDLYKDGKHEEIGKKFLGIIEKDENIRNYFKNQTDRFVEVLQGIIEQDEKDITSLVIKVLDAKELENRKQQLEKDANSAKKTLPEYIQEALDNNVIEIEIVEKAKSLSLKNTMVSYGITSQDLPKIAVIFPLLIDHPKVLMEVYENFKQGKYEDVVKNLLGMVENSQDIKNYFAFNENLFVGVLNKIFENTPALQGYDLKGDLYKILPLLLDHPKELIEIIDLSRQGNYGEIGKKFLDMVQQDEKMKDYFIQNKKLFVQVAAKSTGIEGNDIKNDEIAEIFDLLMKEENTPKIKQLLDLYQEGKMLDLVKKTCDMIDTDPSFKQYINDNKENFAKIINAVINKTPAVKTWTAGAEVGHLVGEILSEPKFIKESVEAYEKGGKALVFGGLKAVGKVLMKGAFWSAVGGYLTQGGVKKQPLVDGVLEDIAKRETTDLINLSAFIKATLKSNHYGDNSFHEKLTKIMTDNTLFDGISIAGSSEKQLSVSNVEVNNITFVNSKFENVSFFGCVFKNCAFTGANIYPSTSFAGSEIDATTLATMVDALRRGKVSLNNVKLVGDLSGIDLSGISLKGADFTKVTSLKGVNFDGANLEGLVFALGKESLLIEAYNINKAKSDDGLVTKEIKESQVNAVLSIVANSIAEKARTKKNEMTPVQITKLTEDLKNLVRDNPAFGEELFKGLEASPADLTNNNFLINFTAVKHLSDYQGKTSYLMTILYENRDNLADVKFPLVAADIGGKIGQRLFGEANNRGQDCLMINKMVETALREAATLDPEFDIGKISQHERYNNLVDRITEELRPKVKYTTAGMVTGGVYFPKESFNDILTNKVKGIVNEEVGNYNFSEAEKTFIQESKIKIAEALFGTGDSANKQNSLNLIEAGLKDAIYQTKAELKERELGGLLASRADRIIGTVEKTWVSTKRTGLVELFYKNSTYTTTGLATGGIYHNENIVGSKNFINSVKEIIGTRIREENRFQDMVKRSHKNNTIELK